jgi:hypothetical protein
LLTSDQSLGALLGFGPNNASKWCRLNDRPVVAPGLDHLPDSSIPAEEMRKTKGELAQERADSRSLAISWEIVRRDPNPYSVSPPGFVAFDSSPETQEVITRHLEDSWRIRDHLAVQHRREPSNSDYADFLMRLVLKNLFQFGPEPPHPDEYLRYSWT